MVKKYFRYGATSVAKELKKHITEFCHGGDMLEKSSWKL